MGILRRLSVIFCTNLTIGRRGTSLRDSRYSPRLDRESQVAETYVDLYKMTLRAFPNPSGAECRREME